MAGLLGMVVLVGMGEHMAEQFLPLYLLALGGGAISIGFLNALDNLLGALYSFPGGYLSDRFGAKRALLVFNLLSMLGFLVVILVPRWEAVLLGAVFFLSWTAISLPATMSLIARVLPKGKRTMGVSMHSLIRRIPMALGPILGGLCIGKWGVVNGVRAAFAFALVLAVAAAILQETLIESDTPAPGKAESNPLPSSRSFRWSC
jgi:MFS family permease